MANPRKLGDAKPMGLRDHPPKVARLPKVEGPLRLEVSAGDAFRTLSDGAVPVSADLASLFFM